MHSSRPLGFLVALLLVAANLRPSLTGVGPLLLEIQQQLSLSATAAGLLNSLPLLIFAAAAPLAGLADRHGAERLTLVALITLGVGTLLRSEGSIGALFAGTVVLASGIAVANVLIPVLIKQHFPDRIATVTTAYATVLGAFAGLASGVSVPLARVLPGDWRGSLGCWSLLALLAILLWLPHLRPVAHSDDPARQPAPRRVWRTSLGWQITAFMGLQSAIFYTIVTWYPAILSEAGFSLTAAGWMLTLYQFVGIAAGLAIPMLIRRLRDQRLLALITSLFATAGNLGLLLAPSAALLWMAVLGIGTGPCLILALSFVGLRASTAQTAAALSLMMQGLGYLLAAFGPVVFGYLHDSSGGWSLVLSGLALLGLLQGLCGYQAGRTRKI
ncbi:MAG: MFS transporter [Steroidobacteraceae bacterium]